MKQPFGGLDREFWAKKPLIGMVHLLPLPGSPRDDGQGMEPVLERAIADAKALESGGADAIMIENFFDAPFVKEDSPAHTLVAMTQAVSAIRKITSCPLGVNVLRNDAISALAIAHICSAQFVRVNVWVGAAVTDQGIIEGAARKANLYRRELGANVAILADVFVKHATQIGGGSLEDAAKDAVLRGLADGLILSGTSTGSATSPEDLRRVKTALPDSPLLVGSGFNLASAHELLTYADAAIVGTSLKPGGDVTQPVDLNLVVALKRAIRQGTL